MSIDPIANMLISIKNASKAGNPHTLIPYSKLKFEIVNVLVREGYVQSFSVKGKKATKRIEIDLAYGADKRPRVEDVERISKPSRRIYAGAKESRPVRKNLGTIVLSTPKGILTGDQARKENVGGEVLFAIW